METEMGRLQNKVAVITGGSSGIGLAAAVLVQREWEERPCSAS
jgi:NAD(P)-dependent dehydrogenase (short-subunit alcohol dehydrogenase family)